MDFRIFFLLIMTTTLSGCVSEQALERISAQSDRSLCMKWMTSPDINRYKRARKEEINERGIDCWEYGNVAEEERKANQRMEDAAQKVARSID